MDSQNLVPASCLQEARSGSDEVFEKRLSIVDAIAQGLVELAGSAALALELPRALIVVKALNALQRGQPCPVPSMSLFMLLALHGDCETTEFHDWTV